MGAVSVNETTLWQRTELVIVFAALGCSPQTPPIAAPAAQLQVVQPREQGARAQPKRPRLVATEGKLYATELKTIAARGALLYALRSTPIPGTQAQPPVGLVKVLEPPPPPADTVGAHLVEWFCKPESPQDAAVERPLPLEMLHPDIEARVGKCWARYKGLADTWRPATAVIRINVGNADRVRAGDLFDVLGGAEVDAQGRVVTELARVARCAVQPFDGGAMYSDCQIDRASWPSFSQEIFLAGGFVHWVETP
jgi:hypothetical protein